MTKLTKQNKIVLAIIIICLATAAEGVLGSRFFHGEMSRQIDETLRAQAIQMVAGYELYDQNREILMAGIQADALEINRIHGDFISTALNQAYDESVKGTLDDRLIVSQVRAIIKNSEDAFHLKSVFIENASSHRNDLDPLIRDAVQRPGYSFEYLAKSPSELYYRGSLDIIMRSGEEKPWNAYARAIYFSPIDMIVIFEGETVYEEDMVARLVKHIQNINERTVKMSESLEDVIVLQENGYSLYSGRFDTDSSRRVTRLVYHDLKKTGEFPASILGNHNTYKTLMVKNPDGHMQERYAYILYDDIHKNYVLVSRLTSDIRKQEAPLIRLSRFVALINIFVVSAIAVMLISRTEALEEEDAIS